MTLGLTPANGGITMVMSTHMNRVLSFNETNQTITVESGIMGTDYEAMLNDAPKVFKAKGDIPADTFHSLLSILQWEVGS